MHWDLFLERHHSATNFNHDDVCGSPLFAPPSTSARVQSRFEFVDLVVVCALTTTGVTGITVWYQRGTSWYNARYTRAPEYMYKYIWYVQVPEVHLQMACEYMNAYVPFVTYVWRTMENKCISLVLVIFYYFCTYLLLFTV